MPVSLWETIPRSLATTFITLLPISALYLFGGETLKDFAFALLVGIGAGAYSSIFIAAPLLSWLKEREPEYARRKDESFDAGSVGGLLKDAEEAAAARPTPDLIPDAFQDDGDAAEGAVAEGAARPDEARPPPPAAQHASPWPGQITSRPAGVREERSCRALRIRHSCSASSSTSWPRSCARASTS